MTEKAVERTWPIKARKLLREASKALWEAGKSDDFQLTDKQLRCRELAARIEKLLAE